MPGHAAGELRDQCEFQTVLDRGSAADRWQRVLQAGELVQTRVSSPAGSRRSAKRSISPYPAGLCPRTLQATPLTPSKILRSQAYTKPPEARTPSTSNPAARIAPVATGCRADGIARRVIPGPV